jgi:tetratricopeptide (TPR) repeat protein
MYERALKADPERAVAASNLGVIYASRGDLRPALPLWEQVFADNPGLSEVGLNLGIELLRGGGCREGTGRPRPGFEA